MRRKHKRNIAMLLSMESQGMTCRDVAEAAGLSYCCVVFTLNQRTDPKPQTAAAIAQALKTTPAALGWEVQS